MLGGLIGTPPVVTQGLPPTEQDGYNPRPAGWEDAEHPYLPGDWRFFF